MSTAIHAESPDPVQSAYQSLMDIIGLRWKWSAVVEAVRLDIANLLAAEPLGLVDLAHQSNTQPDALATLLRFLSYSGIFAEPTPGVFANTDQSYFLRSDVSCSARTMVLMEGSGWHTQAWDALEHSVTHGTCGFSHSQGDDLWSYFARNADDHTLFDGAMYGLSQVFDQELVRAFDFSRVQSVVDIGGGLGSFLATILDVYPHLQGTLVENEQTATTSDGLFPPHVRDRVVLQPGSALAAVPAGADVYLLKQMLHCWDDTGAVQILRACRRAMQQESTLLLFEMFTNPPANNIPPQGYPPFVGLQALQMLVLFGGQERTEVQFQQLLREADMECTEVRRTASPYRLLVCKPLT